MSHPQHSHDNAASNAARLTPVLGLLSAVAIVVGGVIGSGVFFKPNVIARGTEGYVGLILSLWIVCGLVNLCGALALAELSAMMPHAGGSYVFLREAYGRPWGFAWAWAEFWVIRSGSTATLAAAMTIPLKSLAQANGYELNPWTQRGIALATIAGLATVNIIGTRWGGAMQNVTTAIKGAFVVFLAVLPFVAIGSQTVAVSPLFPATVSTGLLAGIGGALAGIMWAYDGWAALPNMSEEVRNPQRNVPRALIAGIVILTVLYTGANLAYHLTLPSAEIARLKDDTATAAVAAEKLMPDIGQRLTLAMIMVSVFGALNSNMLTGPRVLFAAARDYRFLGPLRRIDPRFGTPALAIGAVAAWSCILILAGDLSRNPNKALYDVLSDYCIFGASLFYLAAVLAVFVLRRTRPDAPRPYRAWGYPWLPGVFAMAYVFILASMFWARTWECTMGLTLIVAGLVFYAVYARGQQQT